jgi:WD40 repeat protein
MVTQLGDVRSGIGPASSPYRGLMPYTEADADFFFGRDGEIVLIANNARANRFGVLYGTSGVGKSSVLRAGVVWHIRDENRRRQQRYGDLETVVAYLKEWRDDPNAALATEIAAAFHDADGTEADIPAGDVVRATVGLCEDKGVDLVVILDQFEEFSLYHRPEVTDFAEVIARLTAPSTAVNVLVAIREDALSWLDEFEGIVPDVFANTLRLDHLDEVSARSAITEPLRRYNAGVPEAERRKIEPALVDALLHEVRAGRVKVDQLAEPSTDPALHDTNEDLRIEAPYLQLVLTRLWAEETRRQSRVLRLTTLGELGGAQEIVRQHLDRVMRAFSPPEMAVLADAFGHLVTPSGSKIAHRPSDLAELSGHDPALVAALMRRLAEGDQRILRDVPPPMDEPHAEPRYEIFHDVLALAVLDWRRRFLAEAQSRRQQAELLAEKERVEQETRHTRNRLRKARALIGAMALLLLACAALAGWAVHSRGQAEDAKGEAALNRTLTEVNSLLTTDPAAALKAAQQLTFEHDDSRYEDAYRRAMDGADTDVVLTLGRPVALASFVGDDAIAAVTRGGRIVVWDMTSTDPIRVDAEPRIDQHLLGGAALQAVSAVSDTFVVVRTGSGIWSVDLESGDVDLLDTPGMNGPSLAVAGGGRRDRLLVYDNSGHALLWDVAQNSTRTLPYLRDPTDANADPAIDPTGEYVAALDRGSNPTKVQVWSVATGREVASTSLTSTQEVGTGSLSFTATEGAVVPHDPVLLIQATGRQTEVSLWDVHSEPIPLGHGNQWRQVYDLAELTTRGSATDEGERSRIAVAGDKSVTIFDHDGTFQAQTAAAHAWITAVETDPKDPSVFALAALEGYVGLYRTNLDPPQPMWTFRGHRGSINDLSFSADGRHLITAGADGKVRVWRLPKTDVEWYVPDWILGARYAPGGRYVFGYSPLKGGYVTRGDGEGSLDYAQANLDGQMSGMDPAPDGDRVVVVDKHCHLPVQVSVVESTKVATLDKPDDEPSCAVAAAWNPDPSRHQIVAGTLDGELVSWDAESGKVTGSVDLREDVTRDVTSDVTRVVSVAISGDGRTVVAGTINGEDRRIHVLDASDFSDVSPEWKTSGVRTLDVSADGRFVVSGGGDRGQVTVWDVEDPGQAVHTLSQLRGSLDQVTISPDAEASRVAATTSEGTVYVWDRESGRLLAAMTRHADAATEVAFDPDDLDHMVSAGDDGFMVSYTCELCALGVDELKDAAEDRLAQEVDVAG